MNLKTRVVMALAAFVLIVQGAGARASENTTAARASETNSRFTDPSLRSTYDEASKKFGHLKGVDISIRDGRVEMDGEVAEPDDYKSADSFAKGTANVRNRLTLSDDVIGNIAEAIRREIGPSGIRVRSLRDKIVLEGIALGERDKERAVEIAELFYPSVLDLVQVKEGSRSTAESPLIELEFHMMEVKRGALKQFGINWAPGSFSEGNGAAASGGGMLSSVADFGRSILGFVFQLVPKLRFISEKGDGRVLENPSVVVKSGERAKVFSGSEVPYYQGDEVSFKRVGIDIDAEPVLTDKGVDLRLTATLSSPSADLRGALDTNTITTTAFCPLGQSLVLANVVRHGDVKMRNRVPKGIDTSSALFTLFLSKDFQSNRSEFVIFVTPKLAGESLIGRAPEVEFEKLKRSVIKDRSKQEFIEYLAKHGQKNAAPEDEGAVAAKPKRRKWR